MKTKAFIEALSIFSRNPKKTKTFFLDKRLTILEKRILECYFLLRSNKIKEVLGELSEIGNSQNFFIQSQKHLIQGIAFNNIGKWDQAKREIATSLELLPKDDMYFHFIAYYNLFIIALNSGDRVSMLEVLKLMQALKLTEPLDKLGVHRCSFNYYAFMDNFTEAQKYLDQIEPLSANYTESTKIGLLIDKFIFYCKKEDFKACYKVLEEAKLCKKFSRTQNYNFMKILLDHYVQNKPIYFTEAEFVNYPTLNNQIKVIKYLEERDKGKALECWNKLRLISPNNFKPDFNYNGEKNIFSLCLQKHLSKVGQQNEIDNIIQLVKADNKIDLLYQILINSQAPLNREDLYLAVYKTPVEFKEDYLRLSRIMVKVKAKYKVEVEYRKNCYFISAKSTSKAS